MNDVYLLRSDQWVSGVILLAGVGLLVLTWQPPAQSVVEPLRVAKLELQALNPVPIFTPLLTGVATSSAEVARMQAAFTATLSAEAIYVMDVPTASVLVAKEPAQFRSPASTTKLMTALVAMDLYAPNQVLTVVTEAKTEGAGMGLETSESLKVEDLLLGLLVQSGNDAAMVLANNHPQGLAGFVMAMNAKAIELGLENTTYTNPAGLDGFGHLSSARDLAILGREVMKNPVLQRTVQQKEVAVSDTTLVLTHALKNTNELLGIEPGVVGIKTGTTELAGEVLITQLQRDGREILVVVMGSQSRYFETKNIYDWVFDHYSWKNLDSGTLK